MTRKVTMLAALALTILLVGSVASDSAQDGGRFFLKAGDRVVFLGDSITFQKLYTRYIDDFTGAFFGDLQVKFFNAGVNGDTAPGALKRLDRDVLAHNPTVVTICFGMNDCRIWPKDLEKYKNATSQLVERCRAAGARVVLLTPPCVDEGRGYAPVGLNARLWTFSRKLYEVGKEKGVPVIDLFHPFLVALHKGQSKDRNFTLIPDGIHPNPQGHYVIAMTILEAWNWQAWKGDN